MRALLEPLLELDSFVKLLEAVKKKTTPVLATGAIGSSKSHITYGLMESTKSPALIVAESELAAKAIYDDMRFFIGDGVFYYPCKDIIFYSADVRSADIIKQRFNVIDSLLSGKCRAVVLSVEALFDRLTERDVFEKSIIHLAPGERVTIETLTVKLARLGYERSTLVEGPGQFAVRGGIVDIYTTLYENAVRIEFWGDEIDSIRFLDTYSQRSIDKTDSIRIFPMRELLYGEDEQRGAADEIEIQYKKSLSEMNKKGLIQEAENLTQQFANLIERLRDGGSFPEADKYAQFFNKNDISLLDYLPENALLFFDEPDRIRQHSENVSYEYSESIKNRILKGYMLPSQMDMVFSYAKILEKSRAFKTILFTAMTHMIKDFTVRERIDISSRSSGVFKQKMDMLAEDLKYRKGNNQRILILGGSRFRGQRLSEEIAGYGLPVAYIDDITAAQLTPGVVTVTRGSLNSGFEYTLIGLAIISDKDLFGGEKVKRKRRSGHKGTKIESFTDLRVGDYIVHTNHGIGVYKGIEQIVVDNINRDYLKLEYSDGGALYVHTGQMDMIQKYIGSEGTKLKLNKLGGTEWARAKAKTRKSLEILAKDLVELYAKRQASTGYIYPSDTVWQKEFEDLFPYEETDDQLSAIEDVKKDMESGKVMDRLLCGDVGYGKTEVAIRAAFKAVQDGRQVAYLVPTTILAQQHYNTFTQRMKDFPVSVEMLCRFRSPAQQRESISLLEKGLADIVIGTHRLLSKDIKFKNLGLIIVDEEQRFGVTHKEKLKKMRENADVLTLTATPIPRTLHMSLTGIRDMSILEEPPLERQPVQTYVMEYNPEFVRDAINRELARNGQVYYLHNRVLNISEVARKVKELVPDASVAYAHGQMSERELENVMMDFIEGSIDVLVCTTIIETGLDISNVNTIIIQDADYMGLSQLYQLRGRVGRSNKLAYAYLMYRKDKILPEAAEKRLQTIREFTEFGSGFKIAMRDLEIRGAGNLLGEQQHGHMDAVGYDMYCKLLAETIMELKGETSPEEFETSIDIKINAYIPIDYIDDEEQKLEIYKKISSIDGEKYYYEIQEEIEDRFGDLPKCVQNLLDVALLKAEAHIRNIISINQKTNKYIVTFKPDASIDPQSITELAADYYGKIYFTSSANPYITYVGEGDAEKEVSILKLLIRRIR